MEVYDDQYIMQMIKDEDVEFIRMQFTDIFGTLKNVAVTSSQIDRALGNKCMFDGSSISGFSDIEESDMYLYPDKDTFNIFPWRPQRGKVARMICDIYKPDGTPFAGSPRYILKKVLKQAADMGYEIYVGPELEFFLFQLDENGMPTTKTDEQGGYFDLAPVDKGENARRDMVLTLEEMGYEIESTHHEMAPAQHEIDFKYDEAMHTADDIITFKLVVRSIANQHGLFASFMPKPVEGVQGSGMHISISMRGASGANLFCDEHDANGLSPIAYQFMAGVLRHARGMMAITNPLVNSYKRIVPGYEAPEYISWSPANRSAYIRIPSAHSDGRRLELRCPDPSANPYLVLAVTIAAGLEGIKERLTPPPMANGNIFAMSDEERCAAGIETLPRTLSEAIDAMEEDALIRKVLGEDAFGKYLDAKKKEWEEYRRQVSQWEIDRYLNII